LEYSFDVNLQPEWFGGEVLCDVGGYWVDVLFDDGDEKCVKIPPASAGAVWRWLEATDEEAATRQTSSPAAKKRLMPRCDASHSGGQSSSHRSRKRKVEDDQGEEESANSSASASQGSLDAAAMGPRSTLRWPEAEVDQLMQMVKEEGPGDWNGKAKRLGDGNRTGNSLSSYWNRMTTTVQRKRSKREPGVWPAPKYPVPTDRRVAKQAAAAAPPCSAARFPLENGRNVRSANKTSVFQVSSTPFPSNILTKDDGLPRQAQDKRKPSSGKSAFFSVFSVCQGVFWNPPRGKWGITASGIAQVSDVSLQAQLRKEMAKHYSDECEAARRTDDLQRKIRGNGRKSVLCMFAPFHSY